MLHVIFKKYLSRRINRNLINKLRRSFFSSNILWNYPFSPFINRFLFLLKIKDIQIIRSSLLFDPNWYNFTYQSIPQKIDPAVHYVWQGWRDLRNPGPEFNTARYIARYDQYGTQIQNPLVHYELYGKKKGYNPSPSWIDVYAIRDKADGTDPFHLKRSKINEDHIRNIRNHSLKILFIGHDASGTGAPMVLLHILKWIHENTCIEAYLILLQGGPLLVRYQELAPVWVLNRYIEPDMEAIESFCGKPDLIYGNTVISANLYDILKNLKIPIITHVHEMEYVINQVTSKRTIKNLVEQSSVIIAVSDPVAENLIERYGCPNKKIRVIPDFITSFPENDQEKEIIRSSLGIPHDCILIIGCGTGVWRKGIDLFVKVANRVIQQSNKKNIQFIWIGDVVQELRSTGLLKMVKRYKLERKITFSGFCPDPKSYFQVADLFLLPSREDPFPLVALEACECELPIICFEDSGGMPSFIKSGPGFAVPYEDIDKMAEKVIYLTENEGERRRIGKSAKTCLHKHHTSDIAVPEILDECIQLLKSKSNK